MPLTTEQQALGSVRRTGSQQWKQNFSEQNFLLKGPQLLMQQ